MARDIYLGMWPATQVNSAWPSLRGEAQWVPAKGRWCRSAGDQQIKKHRSKVKVTKPCKSWTWNELWLDDSSWLRNCYLKTWLNPRNKTSLSFQRSKVDWSRSLAITYYGLGGQEWIILNSSNSVYRLFLLHATQIVILEPKATEWRKQCAYNSCTGN